MKVKRVMDGAPPYMGQYASLMILLLAFFIVLVSFSTIQEAGLKAGIGDIKNAFGLSGGYGIFDYAFIGKGVGYAPNPTNDNLGEDGVENKLMMGEGGQGDTSLDIKEPDQTKYIRFKMKNQFETGSDKLTKDMQEELRQIGIGVILGGYKIQIRCFSMESGDPDKNKSLALSRAAQVMRSLEKNGGVPYDKMECIGYSNDQYFTVEQGPGKTESPDHAADEVSSKQGLYFYIFVKNNKV